MWQRRALAALRLACSRARQRLVSERKERGPAAAGGQLRSPCPPPVHTPASERGPLWCPPAGGRGAQARACSNHQTSPGGKTRRCCAGAQHAQNRPGGRIVRQRQPGWEGHRRQRYLLEPCTRLCLCLTPAPPPAARQQGKAEAGSGAVQQRMWLVPTSPTSRPAMPLTSSPRSPPRPEPGAFERSAMVFGCLVAGALHRVSRGAWCQRVRHSAHVADSGSQSAGDRGPYLGEWLCRHVEASICTL